MNTNVYNAFIAAVLICLLQPAYVAAENQDSSGKWSYEQFRILVERNIFNPDRRKKITVQPRVEPTPVIEEFSLIGTMIADATVYAFFEGTHSGYDAVCKLGETIADHEIVEIGTSNIKLQVNGQPLTLSVGMALRRQDQGEWQLASASGASRRETRERRTSGGDRLSPVSTTETEKTDAPGESSSDLLKKMMERRRQEMQK
ncbi:MAG: hypothetical protein C4527_15185 [Candidatus Omnitrophota bacterium]|jgi:hypothetical protein|nr:MAG: hypothetical protein C4527_15185 [Candidatus Omnitrophota bacterium]